MLGAAARALRSPLSAPSVTSDLEQKGSGRMPSQRPTVVTAAETHAFMEGTEECKEYFRSPHFWVGVSHVPVGQTGGTDPGHPKETEIFLCVQGSVEISDGDTRHRLNEADALVIPPGIPHTITNIGNVPAMLVWAGAGS